MLSLSCLKSLGTYRTILSLVCSAIFLIQLVILVSNYVQPTELNTAMKIVKLEQLDEFPLVFQFCIRPGFNMTKLKHNGYYDMDNYFWGTAEGSKDVGWAGNDTSISPAGKNRLALSNAGCEIFTQNIHWLGNGIQLQKCPILPAASFPAAR